MIFQVLERCFLRQIISSRRAVKLFCLYLLGSLYSHGSSGFGSSVKGVSLYSNHVSLETSEAYRCLVPAKPLLLSLVFVELSILIL